MKKVSIGLLITLSLSVMTISAAQEMNDGELEISWKMLTGYGTYSEYGYASPVLSSGLMVEVLPGKKISSVPGLDFGLSTVFFILPGKNSFELTNSLTSQDEHWELTTYVMGSALMAKYGYELAIGAFQIGLENGLGLMYAITQEEHRYYSLAAPNIIYSGRTDVQGFGPIADLHLKVHYKLNDYNRLGLNVGGFLANFEAAQYHMISVLAIGLSYQVSF